MLLRSNAIYGKVQAMRALLIPFLLLLSACVKYGYVAEKKWERSYDEEAKLVDYKVVDLTPSVILELLEEERLAREGCYHKVNPGQKHTYKVLSGDKLFVKLAVINTGLPHEINDNTDLVHILPQAHKSKDEASFIVDNAGYVSLPYAGKIQVGGKTIDTITDDITLAFKDYFKNPFVEVKLYSFGSQFASVTGEVHQPGQQPLSDQPLTLIKAIAAAGGVKDTADLTAANIQRTDGHLVYVDLFSLLHHGDMTSNHILRDQDILNIPYTNGNKIFITGEVNDRKIIKIPAGQMTLTEALIEGNGPHHWAADRSRVYVIRGGNFSGYDDIQNPCEQLRDKPYITAYYLNMNMPQTMTLADRFMMRPRDVLYVATREVTQWNRLLTQVIPNGVSSLIPKP